MRLKEDSTSWKSGGIKRRDFRHDPGLPETETPKGHPKGKNVKKHVHTYKRVVLGTVTTRTWWSKGHPIEVVKEQHICSGCGHRRTYTGGSRWGW